MKKDPLTYSELLNGQTQLVTQHQLNAQTAANRATALRLFLRANHLQIDDVVGMEMRPHFPISVEKLVDTVLKNSTPSVKGSHEDERGCSFQLHGEFTPIIYLYFG